MSRPIKLTKEVQEDLNNFYLVSKRMWEFYIKHHLDIPKIPDELEGIGHIIDSGSSLDNKLDPHCNLPIIKTEELKSK